MIPIDCDYAHGHKYKYKIFFGPPPLSVLRFAPNKRLIRIFRQLRKRKSPLNAPNGETGEK